MFRCWVKKEKKWAQRKWSAVVHAEWYTTVSYPQKSSIHSSIGKLLNVPFTEEEVILIMKEFKRFSDLCGASKQKVLYVWT